MMVSARQIVLCRHASDGARIHADAWCADERMAEGKMPARSGILEQHDRYAQRGDVGGALGRRALGDDAGDAELAEVEQLLAESPLLKQDMPRTALAGVVENAPALRSASRVGEAEEERDFRRGGGQGLHGGVRTPLRRLRTG